MRERAGLVLVCVVSCAVVLGGCGSSSRPPTASTTPSSTTPSTTPTSTTRSTSTPALPAGEDSRVVRVVDGDTIVVAPDIRVRFIGIDTPETKDPRKPVQCFGREASARTAALLPPGERVRLVYDVERFDRYDRTLAYVYRATDGVLVNAALVRDGFASAYTYPPNVAHADEFVALQRDARDAGRGLWGACGGTGVPADS